MRNFLLSAAIALTAPLTFGAVPAAAQAPAAASTGYSVETTDLGTLLDDAAAKAVLMKYIPAMIGNDQIQMARPMTLKQLQQYAGESLTNEKLVAIQADFDKLAKH